ncbi:heavy metal translocating P-type ATPase [Spiroplasma endosymbiont of Danaus chrysippus]|uniref:heavy metal translocating P-type ATPase n=1 Tax=Spiroplasma endosymbiont of Danaus chrysippus TaxID=2691041 RepID=UPI00157AD411|nr:cation-translocating P-type ATPase [Spiroplasma endosymbiont of Danaus chrysippus]
MNNTSDINDNFVISRAVLSDVSCTSCASVIERHFTKEDGITVSINFATKKAQFSYDPKFWNEKKIKKAMDHLGYEICKFEPEIKDLKTSHQVDMKDITDDHSSHSHSSEQHQSHMSEQHRNHQHNVKLRDLIELIIGWILLLPLLLIMIPNTSFFDSLRNPYIQLALALPIQFYFGRKFYIGIYRELIKQKWPGMHTLVALGTTTAFIFSIYLMIINKTEHLYFEVSASIIMIVLLGDLISAIAQKRATSGLESLMSLKPKSILKYDYNTKTETFINIEDVQLNDILIIRKGENIPTDGQLISEEAFINESMLTGESQVITKQVNQNLIGGTNNVGDSFRMKATKIGKDTVLASIIKAVEDAQSQKPKLQKLADKISGWFTPTVILIAILVFLIRYFAVGNGVQESLEIAIATLIIACPCALGIATPLAVAVGINKAAKIGIIYNKASAFEKITKIDTICFDKTGTLTTGNLVITKIYGQEKHVNKAIAMEKHSTHPLALAFSLYANTNNVGQSLTITEVKEQIGFGIKAKYQTEELQISSLENLQKAKMPFSPFLKTFDFETVTPSQKVLALAINKVVTNIFILEDELQTNALLTIEKVKKQGIEVILISGDNESQTLAIANRVGIETYFANVTPQGKSQIVADLQAKGKKVAFVGDGINDVIALEQSDLAIAMGSGSDIAKKIGDITILDNDISIVYKAIVLTKKTKNNIWINFIWAFSYNIIIIPLAAAGFIIPPLAAIAMALSDITVVGNSLIFKWRKYKY